MAVEPLSKDEIEQGLEELPGWRVDDDLLTRTYSFAGHPPAAAMVAHVSQIQEELGHHSEQTLGYNTLKIAVNTHSVGGRVTAKDLDLARRIEAVAKAHGAK
jgi:4a-hydroxytetrahydrobiopterin dehydratase